MKVSFKMRDRSCEIIISVSETENLVFSSLPFLDTFERVIKLIHADLHANLI